MRVSILLAFAVCMVSACGPSECGEGLTGADGSCGGTGGQVVNCNPSCKSEDHEYCGGTADAPECTCVAGYTGSPCTWGLVPDAAEFDASGVWTSSNGATVVKEGLGSDGAEGIAFLLPEVVCNGGRVSQIVDMPNFSSAEPFEVEITYRARGVEGVAIGVGRAFKTLPPTVGDAWSPPTRFCLGEAGYGPADEPYGGPVELQIGASERHNACVGDPIGTIEVDRVQIVVADKPCPQPGTALNGAADIGEGGWVFEAAEFSQGFAEGSLKASVGRNNTSGARVFREAGSNKVSAMAVPISVPVSGARALSFWWKGTTDFRFQTDIGTFGGPGVVRKPFDTLHGNGEWQHYTYCLPPWTHGNVVDLGFVPVLADPSKESELVVDDVELLDGPECGDSTNVLDPEFNSSPNRWPGVLEFNTSGGSVAIRNDEVFSHTKPGVLEISYATNEAAIWLNTWVLVPDSDGNEGPQLVFWSWVPPIPDTPVRWLLGRDRSVNRDFPATGKWERNPLCLPPEWSGRWYRFNIEVGPSGDQIKNFVPDKKIRLDDFELTTSSDCPAE